MPGLVTVTAAPATSQLTTLANAKSELSITGSSDDAYLGRLIDQASGLIARHCGRAFGRQTVAEAFRFGWQPGVGPAWQQVAPYGTPLNVQLKPLIVTYPGCSITSAVENSDSALDPAADFEADTAAGLVWRLRNGLRSWWGVPLVTITYATGYQLPNDSAVSGVPALPAEIEGACLALVTSGYAGRGRDPSITMELQEGVGRVLYAASKSASHMTIDDGLDAMLAPYVAREW